MAGTLIINESSGWLPAGWLFDAVLEGIASEIGRQDPGVIEALQTAKTEGGAGYLDIRQWESQRIAILLNAAQRLRARRLADGAGTFHDPRGFPLYMEQLDALIAMLLRDPRLSRTAR